MNPQEKNKKRNSIKVQKLQHKWAPLTKKKKETSSNKKSKIQNQKGLEKKRRGNKWDV